MFTLSQYKKRSSGFTLVELLVVITVIVILAGIVLVAYSGWRQNVTASKVKSDLNGAAAAMESAKNWSTGYPATVPTTFHASPNVTITGGSTDGQTFCISAASTEFTSIVFRVTNTNTSPQSGTCATVITVATFAGTGTAGLVDGAALTTAQFNEPEGVAIDNQGVVWVADVITNAIRKITPDGTVSTPYGGSCTGLSNGTYGIGSTVCFNQPSGIAFDPAGDLYIADTGNNCIRRITPDGTVTVFAGASASGYQDGIGSAARFNAPADVATDATGNVYVADWGNNRIRKISPTGVVTTLAGSGTASSTNNSNLLSATFNHPSGVAVDAAGNVYTIESSGYMVRKITTATGVTTIAGNGTSGSADSSSNPLAASFSQLSGITVNATGTVYVTDYNYHTVRQITATSVTTLAGSVGGGFHDGAGAIAQFYDPWGLTTDASGKLYIADSGNNRIRSLTVSLQ